MGYGNINGRPVSVVGGDFTIRGALLDPEACEVEEIIDPRDTRPLLCEFVRGAQEITATQLGPKSRVGIRP